MWVGFLVFFCVLVLGDDVAVALLLCSIRFWNKLFFGRTAWEYRIHFDVNIRFQTSIMFFQKGSYIPALGGIIDPSFLISFLPEDVCVLPNYVGLENI